MTFELRWLERETERILQYRVKESITDYGSPRQDGGHDVHRTWSEWTDVPVVVDIYKK
jgi:hypothetical protein